MGTGQATPEVIGRKRSYALKWCKPNNDDDDDDDSDLLGKRQYNFQPPTPTLSATLLLN